MLTKCPHCGQEIELVGANELKSDFKLGANSVQHARERGKFPLPWLSFGNRNIFLRNDIESYIEQRSRQKIESTVQELVGALQNLPPQEQEEARKLLRANFIGQ